MLTELFFVFFAFVIKKKQALSCVSFTFQLESEFLVPANFRCKESDSASVPRRWQQDPANLGFKRLLIWLLNDSIYNVIILFPVKLIEYTGWGVGGGRTGQGEELMPCDEAPN